MLVSKDLYVKGFFLGLPFETHVAKNGVLQRKCRNTFLV